MSFQICVCKDGEKENLFKITSSKKHLENAMYRDLKDTLTNFRKHDAALSKRSEKSIKISILTMMGKSSIGLIARRKI